jgi:hypothetical protein
VLQKEPHLYVERAEDRDIVSEVRRGNYVTLIGARQTGKTSVLLSLRRLLLEEGHIPVYLDLSPARDRDREGWYRYFHSVLQGQLKRDNAGVSVPHMRDQLDFREALRHISLDLPPSQQVVIMLDEVSALPLDVSDLFFSTIRTVFNERETFPEFQRYVFVMAGTFIPDELVQDPDISPFNIARQLYTSDADREGLAGLVQNLEKAGCPPSDQVVGRVYYWTGGHLYLTQRLCSILAREEPSELTPEMIDSAVDEVLSDRNIEHVYGELDELPDGEENVKRVLEGDRPLRFSRASRVVAELDLIGVIKPDADGCCRVRNAIYRKALAEKYNDLSAGDVGELTRLENELFEYFCRNVNRTCSKYEIAKAIWGETAWGERSIEDRIYRLVARVRDKLDSDPANTLQIKTVHGRGYKPQRMG